jgi:mannosyltransferase PIG-M
MKSLLGRRWLIAVVTATALSFAAKVAITINSYGAIEALVWETNLQEYRHRGALELYRTGILLHRDDAAPFSVPFNHPPFMMHALSFWGWLSDFSGLPLRSWLRFMCAGADLASVVLIAGILSRSRIPFDRAALFMVAGSPVSLLVSGFHCNTDPIMVAFLLLSLYLLGTGRIWAAGAALGMAVNIKIVPVVFTPAMSLFLRGRRRIEFLAGAAIVFAVGSLPMIAQDPMLILDRVFGYTPQSGMWGLSLFVLALGTEAQVRVYARIAKVALLGVLVAVSLWMNVREHKPPPILLQCALLAFLFLALTPGFGSYYLVWLVPWTCVLRSRETLAFHTAGSAFLCLYYNRASRGLPWYFADSVRTPVWYGSLILLGLLCWLVICVLSGGLIVRCGNERRRPSASQRLDVAPL